MSLRGRVQTLLQKNLRMSMPRWNDASVCLDICRYVCIYLEAWVFPGAPPALGRPVGGVRSSPRCCRPRVQVRPRSLVGAAAEPGAWLGVSRGSLGCQSVLTLGWGLVSCLCSGAVGFLTRTWAGVLLQDS